MSRLSGSKLLEIYLEFRSRGAQSSLGKLGQGGSSQPASDMTPVGMMASTIGISMSRCPLRYRDCSFRGSVLELYVKLLDGERRGLPTLSAVRHSDEFGRALVWLEEDMRRRRAAERGHHD